jgi:esterase/lipase superfamily enzyme
MTLVHFATNREEVFQDGRVVGFTERLNPKSPIYLRYGTAEMTATFGIGEIRVAEEQIPGVTAPAGAAKVRGSDHVFESLRLRLKENKADLLMLMHGYACTVEDALSNAAQLKIHWAPEDKVLESAVFSWPTNGRMVPILDYASDRDDARLSAKAVARSLLRLMDYLRSVDRPDWCDADFHLVAHSMGNYLLRNALQALLSDIGERPLPRLFKNIFLMAADEDADAFEDPAKLARLPELAEAVHVYFARNDLALTISDKTKARPDRLGSTGPRTLTALPHKVTLIDCTDVSETPSATDARHQYYRRRDEVIADVRQVIAGKAPEDVVGRRWIAARRCFMIDRQA